MKKLVNFVVFSSYKTSFKYPKNAKLILSGSSSVSNDTLDLQSKQDCFRDDKGENISILNPYYSEYSSMYWVWKNYEDFEYISWNHYRRFFINGNLGKLYYIITGNPVRLNSNKVIKILDSNKVILSKKIIFSESVEEQYSSCHYSKDYQSLRKVIKDHHNDYLGLFDEISDSNVLYPFSMFILSKKDFQDYCEWIFSVFRELNKYIDPVDYDNYQKRVYSYLAERLLYIYFKKQNKIVIEYNVINTEAKFLVRFVSLVKIPIVLKIIYRFVKRLIK